MLTLQKIKTVACQVGFDDCGVSEARPLPDIARRFDSWIAEGGHATMSFLERYRDMRFDPAMLLPGARSVISVVRGYRPSRLMLGDKKIAQYAYADDYHGLMKSMLYKMCAMLLEADDFEYKVCVDSAPICEKVWAAEAGLGWIGNNCLLIHPRLGSYCNVGEIVVTARVDAYSRPIENRCGECRRCVEACPNHALSQCGTFPRLEASLCTAYNTIENRAPSIDEEGKPRRHSGGYVFGCDCCQLACPQNVHAEVSRELSADQLAELDALAGADELTFRRKTKHSSLSRISFAQWQRNISWSEGSS